MPRYFTQPAKQRVKAEYDEWWPDPLINIPNVCEHELTDTGLLDTCGGCINEAMLAQFEKENSDEQG